MHINILNIHFPSGSKDNLMVVEQVTLSRILGLHGGESEEDKQF